MWFSYMEVLGEIIYYCVAASSYISYAVAVLSNFSDNPYKCHYAAIKRLVNCLRQDPDKGIIWWKKDPV